MVFITEDTTMVNYGQMATLKATQTFKSAFKLNVACCIALG